MQVGRTFQQAVFGEQPKAQTGMKSGVAPVNPRNPTKSAHFVRWFTKNRKPQERKWFT